MIEMRWRDTTTDEESETIGVAYWNGFRVLQYREAIPIPLVFYANPSELAWSEWQDVPIEDESCD